MSDSGKTTYVGRLWLSVHDKVGRLHATSLPEDMRPLREVSNFLLRNVYPPHTPKGRVTAFAMPLSWAGRKETIPFTLSFADYSGEEIDRIFTDRDAAWTDIWKERATDSVGLMVFLRPSDIRHPQSKRLSPPPDEDPHGPRWAHLRDEDAEPVTETPKRLSGEDPEAYFPTELMPQEAEEQPAVADPKENVHPPTAVALVEVLQFVRHERGLCMGELPAPEAFRVAVVVSCWDAVHEDWQKLGPDPFVERHFPLLYDFMCTNFHRESVRFFGLSSTGGDLADPSFREKYEQSDPERMGELVYHPSPKGDPVSFPDVTLPIGWLLEGESALPDLTNR
ncbi:MAG: hypothetical protein R3F14_29260 [Polyangiaceae bacterium]